MGFVSRHQAEEFLQASEIGTFLIRFSDSELGGVTVAWISSMHDLQIKVHSVIYFAVNEDSNQKEVAMLQPFTRKVSLFCSTFSALKIPVFPVSGQSYIY